MSRMLSKVCGAALTLSLALGSSGCIKKILLDGQIASTRKASAAVSTISDYHVAEKAAYAGLAQFEGMHYLGPDNEDALFLLTKNWASVGYGFMEDEMEQAEDLHGEDSELANYHKARAAAAYTRAIFYAVELMEHDNPGFEAAKKNADTMKAWLANFDDAEKHAPILLWAGQAWLARVNLLKDQPEYVGELFIGYHLLKRSLELDPNYNYGTVHVVLGSYHARAKMAELDESKKHFDAAIKLTNGNALLAKLNLARRYYCVMVDKEMYVKILTEIVEAGDVMPEQRLQNTIAKRRAKRYLTKARMEQCNF